MKTNKQCYLCRNAKEYLEGDFPVSLLFCDKYRFTVPIVPSFTVYCDIFKLKNLEKITKIRERHE